MNFFEAQAKAKRSSGILVLLFLLAVTVLIALTNLLVIISVAYFQTEDINLALSNLQTYATPKTLIIASGLVLFTVMVGILTMYYRLSSGGQVVAESLGGKKLTPNSKKFQHKKLQNVVEEMAIASGIAVPPIYILSVPSINAFAAGHTSDDAVIGVTQGLLDALNREELQGVIAHEFSHIFNGDMRLNMKLTSLLNGILAIGNVGQFIIRVLLRAGNSGGSSRGSKKEGGGGIMVIALLGVGLFIIGYAGVFIGNIIKSRISRKREYLADATAVQYTRYPQGIAGALKKIGARSIGSTLKTPDATTFSHLFFANGVSGFFDTLLATHPPLQKRIRAIEPNWDGKFRTLAQAPKKPKTPKKNRDKMRTMAEVLTLQVGASIKDIAKPQDKHLRFAHNFLASIDPKLKAQLNDPLGAQTVILSLLTEDETTLRNRQWQLAIGVLKKELTFSYILIKPVPKDAYIHLIQLALPALKNCTKSQYETFKHLVEHFIKIDNKINLFEWSIEQIVIRPLDRHFGLRKMPKLTHSTLGGIKKECELLFSMLAQLQYKDEKEAEVCFKEALFAIKATALSYQAKETINFKNFQQAIERIEQAKAPIKERIFTAALLIMDSDDKRTPTEIEMIHALASLMQLPLPPLV